ncbi:hypothetical protein RJ639_035620 [Escallonia herrerae]|uniref:Stress regulated protein n=1 Tax=Escallonia herrerae TaxID=1293975 RepID=A0AA88WRA6_9ASTE|nr:hypothetical protein RJ639_035620 [Escallonia herrerae]
MGTVLYYGGVSSCWRVRLPDLRTVNFGGSGGLRCQVLEQVDEELSKGNEREALSLVKELQGKPAGGLRCFGAARQVASFAFLLLCDCFPFIVYTIVSIISKVSESLQLHLLQLTTVPQRLYTLDELKLNGIEPSSLLSPVDTTLGSIERNLQLAAILGGISAWNVFGFNPERALYLSLGLLFLWTLDLVSFNGGASSLVLDTIGHTFSQKYHNRVIQHEAGHFLIAYLLGVLPRGYTLSSLEAFQKEGSLNVQAGTAFVDFEFLEEVNTRKVSATMLNRFSCIALAGVATEYILYGYAEGGLADINQGFSQQMDHLPALMMLPPDYNADRAFSFVLQLDNLLKSLGFTQKKADSQIRWAVLNTVLLLRRHEEAQKKLAQAMAEGRSVGFCIDIIEKEIGDPNL